MESPSHVDDAQRTLPQGLLTNAYINNVDNIVDVNTNSNSSGNREGEGEGGEVSKVAVFGGVPTRNSNKIDGPESLSSLQTMSLPPAGFPQSDDNRMRTRRVSRQYYVENNVDVSPVGVDSFKSPPQPYVSSDRPLKKRRVKFAAQVIKYPFFGPGLPDTPKIIALRCLELLDGPGLYSLSLVNSIWSKAAMDPALWEA